MKRDQHAQWLADLAADDARRRRQAEPELARKEAALRVARASLAESKAAVCELEDQLGAELQQAADPNGS